MELRADALAPPPRFVLAAHEVARWIPGAVATIGRLVVAAGRDQHDPGPGRAVRRPARARRRAAGRAGAAHRRRRRGRRPRPAAARPRCSCAGGTSRWRWIRRRPPPCAGRSAGLGARTGRAAVGRRPRRRDPGQAGIPSAMLFVRSDAGGVSHAPEESTGADASPRACRRSRPRCGSWRRMTDWEALARPSLRGLERYDPGPSRDEHEGAARPRRAGAAELERGSVRAAARGAGGRRRRAGEASPTTRSGPTPTSATRWRRGMGLPAASIIPAHGAQSLIGAIATAFMDAGTTVVVPDLTYGLYAQVSAAAGARGDARPATRPRHRPGRAWPRRPAPAAPGWCGCPIPTTPPAACDRPGDWRGSSSGCRDRCAVVADEAYMDFADPGCARRPRSATWWTAGR